MGLQRMQLASTVQPALPAGNGNCRGASVRTAGEICINVLLLSVKKLKEPCSSLLCSVNWRIGAVRRSRRPPLTNREDSVLFQPNLIG